ncbi:MAG TPA: HAD family hydrolase [Rhodospirillaceae bacterium]|nr:HAD family hydrolase [Rhodospirillaceae bacterium]
MGSSLALPKAVFFDWDGTLADSFLFLRGAHSHVRNALGLSDLTAEQFDGYFGMPREVLYREIYGDEMELAKQIFEAYVRENHTQLEPLPGAGELLTAVAGHGITMGAVSNKKGDFIRDEIAHFGWQGHFASVVGAGEAARDKPAPDPLLLAIERASLKLPLADIWYVGDTETDLRCSQEAGCVSVFIQHKESDKALIEAYKPALVVRNCHELCGFFVAK